MKTVEDYKNGQLLLIDKPLEWTSFQVVNKLRWHIRKTFQIKKIKVGHAGTLDPLATGLLIICTGKKTKQIEQYQAQVKTYTGTLVLGSTTPSCDLETEIDTTYPTTHISEDLIHQTTAKFTGTIEQYPPVFSALKKDGKRLYEFAREGKEVEISARKIVIDFFNITAINGLEVDFEIQ
ncbi:MAG: tRNA pseudouridine(55) synthase, partial [Flavobacteriaceae bacterium]